MSVPQQYLKETRAMAARRIPDAPTCGRCHGTGGTRRKLCACLGTGKAEWPLDLMLHLYRGVSGVYFVRAMKTEFVKIGICTNSVGARIRALRTGSPLELDLEEFALIDDRDDRFTAEKFLHACLKHQGRHVRGEWFDLSEMEAARLASLARGGTTLVSAHDVHAALRPSKRSETCGEQRCWRCHGKF